jgi:hypothetical protein
MVGHRSLSDGEALRDNKRVAVGSEPGEGDALHSFGPVAKATERFSMILGALESDEALL